MTDMKTIIANNYQKQKILHDEALLNNGVVTELNVASLRNILKEESDNETVLLFKASKILKGMNSEFPIYRDMFSYPAFLQEIISFLKECILWNITPDQLPETSENETELKKILTVLYDMDLAEKRSLKERDTILDSLDDSYVLYPAFYTDLYHYEIFLKLKEKLQMISSAEVHPEKKLFHALNNRQEIEAVAQDLCTRKESANLILCDYENRIPILKQVFDRYGIPFSCIKEDVHTNCQYSFAYLLNFAMHKNVSSFLDAVKHHAFNSECPYALYLFLADTMKEVACPSFREDIPEDYDKKKYYLKNLEAAEKFFRDINSDLTALLQAQSAQEIIQAVFETARKSPAMKYPQEAVALSTIRSTLMDIMPLISFDDLPFILEAVQTISASKETYNNDFIVVTDLKHPVSKRDNTYIIGASASSYPGFTGNKGLFDETYVENIPAYPSMEKRHDAYVAQLSWIENSASKNLFYSYATNDYEGREIQLSYDIETMFVHEKAQTAWPLRQLTVRKKQEHTLDADLAKKLFTAEGKITGSVSSIEKWFQCPYAYFLASGLHIRNYDPNGIDPATVGTLQHNIMEQAVLRYQKQYADIHEDELNEMLVDSFSLLKKLYPNKEEEISVTKERMFSSLKNAMFFLKQMEADTPFVPTYVENKFDQYEITDGVLLRGTIDRIDLYNDLLRIIDYKSSAKNLSDSEIRAGLKLQLLTYLIIAVDLFDKQPAGAYYFSLKDEKSQAYAIKKTRSGLQEFEESVYEETFMSDRKLSGWGFDPMMLEDSFINPGRPKKAHHFDNTREVITMLYDYFRDHLYEGDISLTPIEGACTFCDYKLICRYHGEYRKKTDFQICDLEM